MTKRILKIIVWILCFPLLFPAIFCIPIIAIYAVSKYIFTGKEDQDIFFAPMEWVINLPYNITEKW